MADEPPLGSDRYHRLLAKFKAHCDEYTRRVFDPDDDFPDAAMRRHRTITRRMAEVVNRIAERDGINDRIEIHYENDDTGWNSSTRHKI